MEEIQQENPFNINQFISIGTLALWVFFVTFSNIKLHASDVTIFLTFIPCVS
ncbi:hypothetical protein MJH12_01460 [bacterium]|nr:hypothetical protein [bacterium]